MAKTERTYFMDRGPLHVWAKEHDDAIRRMAGEGMAASAIAQALFDQFGFTVTRSAVIGRASRIGAEFVSARAVKARQARLLPRVRMARAVLEKALKPARVAKPVKQPPAPEKVEDRPPEPEIAIPEAKGFAPLPGVEPVSFMDLTREHCRWPVSGLHGPVTHFCGAPRKDGLSYCQSHAALSKGKGTSNERYALHGIKDAMTILPPREREEVQPEITEILVPA